MVDVINLPITTTARGCEISAPSERYEGVPSKKCGFTTLRKFQNKKPTLSAN
jgi:hypothetical protein